MRDTEDSAHDTQPTGYRGHYRRSIVDSQLRLEFRSRSQHGNCQPLLRHITRTMSIAGGSRCHILPNRNRLGNLGSVNPPLDVPLLPSENSATGKHFDTVAPNVVHDLRNRAIDELHYCATAALVIAGLPGAGKSTALRLLFDSSSDADQPPYGPGGSIVLDSNHVRNTWARRLSRVPYPLWRPVVHITHYARIRRALRDNNGPVVIHECGTVGWSRQMITYWVTRQGRPLHMLLLDVPAVIARAGQYSRGRRVNRSSFRRHCARWRRLMHQIDSGRPPVPNPTSVVIADRAAIDGLQRITFTERPAAVDSWYEQRQPTRNVAHCHR